MQVLKKFSVVSRDVATFVEKGGRIGKTHENSKLTGGKNLFAKYGYSPAGSHLGSDDPVGEGICAFQA